MISAHLWLPVKDFLKTQLNLTAADALIAEWIDLLERDEDGWRLATCLSIDLACGALDSSTLRGILTNIGVVASSGACTFHESLKNVTKTVDLRCCSLLDGPMLDTTDR